MRTRKRHHIIPRFLLARFASSKTADKSFIWRVAKDARAAEISTKDAAVQSHFYGLEEEGLEGSLADAEGRWGSLLGRIDVGTPLEPLASELWGFLYLIGFRASPIRSAFTILAEQFIDHLSEKADGPEVREGLSRNFDRIFADQLEVALARVPPQFHQLIRDHRDLVHQIAKKDLESSDIGARMRDLLASMTQQQIIPKAAKRGHNKGISKLLDQGQGPEAMRPVAWQVLHDEHGSVILSDSPVVAVGGPENNTGAPWKFGKDYRALYLPVSPRTVLVGIRDADTRLLSIPEINAASATLSETAFFCSKFGDGERALSQGIGSRWMPLSEDEVQAILRTSLSTFGDPKE